MTLQNFTKAKALAHFEGAWKTCTYKKYKQRKKCTGGPRGTYRRLHDQPFCKSIETTQTPTCQEAETLTFSNTDFLEK